MAVKYTPDQQRVIDTREKNILVSAAAGSGKTAVLVERIIQRITDPKHPVDIDKLLVVTFTNAAAAGMKERISNAIQDRLALEPENTHLQRQAVLVHQAQITTIHSFCLYLIKNHFEAISLEPDFKVADEVMVKLISSEIKEQVLEEAFAAGKEEFLQMIEFICHSGKESSLEEYMEQLYARAMSMPFPKRWLSERKQDYCFRNLDEFTDTDSGKYLLLHMQGLVRSYAEAYGQLYAVAVQPDGPYMYADLLEAEQEYLMKIAAQDSLEGIGLLLPNMKFDRLPAKKDESVHAGKREWVKNKRTDYKKAIQELGSQFFGKSPQSIETENTVCAQVTTALIDITITYMERLAAEKRRRGIIDFHDMEHMALEILLRETENGYEPTEIARNYQEFFEEIMVDEYQDSNMVQEFLVNAVSGADFGKNNRFMVGDVKQSIYKFRLARPEIFMEKYHKYALKSSDTSVISASDSDMRVVSNEEVSDESIRIDLKQNFRSRREVLEATNSVFSKVMLSELGGISYDEHAALYLGAQYLEAPCMDAELIIATDNKPEHYDNKEWEAYCVAQRIKELVQQGQILDETGKGLRKVTYGDIVLLFRSPSSFEEAYKKVFEEQGLPIFMTSGSGYFDAVEIQNLIKFLQAIENPRLDIPLFGVCTSVFGGFTENELAQVKIHYREKVKERNLSMKKSEQCLYEMLLVYKEDVSQDVVAHNADMQDKNANDKAQRAVILEKIENLLENLQNYRKKTEYMTVAELLYEILRDFHYREYVGVLPDGEKRLANISLLLERAANFGVGSYQGLFAFTSYVNQLHKQAVDYGEAGVGDNTNAVRVMSIHKSKGLEFPVAIVCGMGQNYQMRDKQQMILIDNDMGLGMDYINTTLRSKNRTLRKNVIALKMEQEILAEEQRILYVAMTRAKEKLIMAGYKAKVDDLEADASFVQAGGNRCMLSQVLEARSYLDLCLLAHDQSSPIKLRMMGMDDYVESEISEIVSREERQVKLDDYLAGNYVPSADMKKLQEVYSDRFSYHYPYDNLRNLYSKTSVSELKKASLKAEQEAVFDAFEKAEDMELIPYLPAFMKEEGEVQGAERGTAYHRVLELLDFVNPPRNFGEWKEKLAQMVITGKLSERQKQCIYIQKMQEFMKSNIAQRMFCAAKQGNLHKEQSFFLGVPANTVNTEFPEEETMLVQGIIDAYFEEAGELVLVDYKTDRVEHVQELMERYHVQMEYYTRALEQALGKKVKEVVLYSLALGQEVRLQ